MCTESFLTFLSALVCINAFYLKTMLLTRVGSMWPLFTDWAIRALEAQESGRADLMVRLPAAYSSSNNIPSPQHLSTTPSCKTNPDLRIMSITEEDENSMTEGTTIYWTCTSLKAGHMLPCRIFPRAPWGRDHRNSILGCVRDSPKA